MKVFTKDEATTVERPEHGPWAWPEPVDVMISNTAKFDPVNSFQWREDRGVYSHHAFDLSRMGDPLMFAIAVNMLETLYSAGYAVVKLDEEEEAVGNLTRAELLGALKVEHKQAKEQAEESEIDRFGAMAVNRMIVRERDEARAELKKLVVSFRAANEAHNQMAAKYDEVRDLARELLEEARRRGLKSPRIEGRADRLGVTTEPQEARS